MKNAETSIVQEHARLFEPTESELAVLRLHEAGVRFRILDPIGISEGRQSRVSVLEYRVGDEARRVLWKRMGTGKNLSEDEARGFHERLSPYRRELMSAGWDIPEQYHSVVVEHEGEWQIFSYEHLVGDGDGDTMMANPEEPNFRKWHLLRRTAETLAAYPPSSLTREKLVGQELSRMRHGLDLKLANVVLDEVGKLWFVDLFGPKELSPDGDWRSYSKKLDSLAEEKLMAICATREGALLRMYRLAERTWTALGGIDAPQLRRDFLGLLDSLGLPTAEIGFISAQIEGDFPWLDQVYEERNI